MAGVRRQVLAKLRHMSPQHIENMSQYTDGYSDVNSFLEKTRVVSYCAYLSPTLAHQNGRGPVAQLVASRSNR